MRHSANGTVSDWVGDGLTEHSTGELRPGFVVDAHDIVLDVGCGGGTDSLFSAERGAEVIYVDVNPESIAETTRRLAGTPARRLTPIVSDCNPLPVADGTATKIVANEVMEHVDDPAQFLSELVRVGAPGALYLISVPDPALENMQVGLAAPSHFEKPNHIRIVGRDEFGNLVTDAGLVIERRGSDGFYWAIWWLMFWLCKVDIFERHPMLDSWEQTWRTLLEMPDNARLRGVLNTVLPKSQYIVARKPGTPKRGFGVFRDAMRKLFAGARGAPPRPGAPAGSAGGDPLDPKLVELRDAEGSGWFQPEKNELFPGFTITQDDVVLDAGCGDDIYAATCAKMGAKVIGRDSNPSPLADGAITRVLALQVLDYSEDPSPLLQELARIGKPGARYLFAAGDPVYGDVLRHVAPSRTIGGEAFERAVVASGLIVESVHPGSFYRALRSLFAQLCVTDCGDPRHPLLTHWARTWKAVLDAPDGHKVKTRLDNFMPGTRIIVARKP